MTRAVEENYRITSALDTRPGRNLDPVNTPLSLQAEDENAGESQPFQLTRSQKFDPLKEPPVHDRLKRVSTSSNPTLATSEGSLYGRTAPSSPPSLKRAHSLSQSTRDRISHEQCPIEQPLYDGSGGSRAVDQVFGDDNSDAQEQHSANQSEDLSSAAFDRSNFMQTLTSTMHELHQVRPQEPSVRPIRHEPQNQTHKPDRVTVRIFEASITEDSSMQELEARSLELVPKALHTCYCLPPAMVKVSRRSFSATKVVRFVLNGNVSLNHITEKVIDYTANTF
jgi:hypothetical protein